jgi:hypothetical protein
VFGPALLDAYRLESRVASYPRVLIADSAQPWIPRTTLFEGKPFEVLDCRTDVDGLIYLDIFGGVRAKVGNSPRRSLWGERELFGDAERRLRHLDDARRRAKWGWMLNYLREVVAEFGV